MVVGEADNGVGKNLQQFPALQILLGLIGCTGRIKASISAYTERAITMDNCRVIWVWTPETKSHERRRHRVVKQQR